MVTFFLLLFVVTLIIDLASSGHAYIIFSRLFIWWGEYKSKGPMPPLDFKKHIETTYIVDGQKYAVLVLKRPTLGWVKCGVLKDEEWIDRTDKILYYSGIFRNFHGIGITPAHISTKYKKMAFVFQDGANIHVESNKVIYTTLKEFYSKRGEDIPTLKVESP